MFYLPSVQTGFQGSSTADNTFNTNGGGLYYGPVHYHSADNPTEDGFVGFMTGHTHHGDAKQLILVKQKYTKVTANGFIDDTGFDSGYMGAPPYEASALGSETPPTGPELEKRARMLAAAELDKNVLAFSNSINKMRSSRKRAVIYYSELNQGNVLLSATEHTISVNPNAPTVKEFHHGSFFSIDIGKLMTLNSSLGWLYDYHISSDSQISGQFVNEMISETLIKKMAIFRRRLSNVATSFNRLSSPAYHDYKESDNVKDLVFLVSSADHDNENLATRFHSNKREDIASISELQLTSNSNKKFYRSFYLKDYDLFHNVTAGNYAYVLDIDFEDGIRKAIEKRYSGFKQSVTRFMEYVNLSTMPSKYSEGIDSLAVSIREKLLDINKHSHHQVKKLVSEGSWDSEKNDYTDSFRKKARQDYANIIQEVIIAFLDCYEIVNNKIVEKDFELQKERLSSMLMPDTLEPGSLETFIGMCNDLDNTINGLVVGSSIGGYRDEAPTLGLPSSLNFDSGTIKGSGMHLPVNIMSVSMRLTGKVQALTGTEILFEPDVESTIGSPPKLTANVKSSASPARFFTLNDLDDTTKSPINTLIKHGEKDLLKKISIEKAMKAQITAGDAGSIPVGIPPPDPVNQTDINYNSPLSVSIQHSGMRDLYILTSKIRSYIEETNNRDDIELSKEIEAVIYNVALKSAQPQDFVNSLTEQYKKIAKEKTLLKDVYESIHMISKEADSISEAIRTETSSMEEWRQAASTGNLTRSNNSTNVGRNQISDLFMKYETVAEEVSPGVMSAKEVEKDKYYSKSTLIRYTVKSPSAEGGVLVNNVFYTESKKNSSNSVSAPMASQGSSGTSTSGGSSGGGY